MTMRWLASGVCAVVLVVQLAWCGPTSRQDVLLERSLPQQDALEALPIAESSDQEAPRDRRTLGLIRQYFPGLGRIIDNKIQMITRWLFRVVGRLVLRGGILGGGGGGGGNSSSGGNRRVSIVLPTFPPTAEDEEDDEQSTIAPEATTDANPEENQLSGAESRVYESRVAPPSGFFDLQPAASGDNDAAAATNDDAVAEGSEDGDDSRSKRLTSFGGGSGGSGGGSGNFIFDIIRLVTGSSNTETTDEGSAQTSAGAEASVEKDDGYQAGIPGPITRLFIIANRGIANLVQDLILRLAQTSERIVNFKARLITSII